MVLLRDELQIDGAYGAVTVLYLETHVREDKMIAIDVEALRLSHGEPGVPIGLTIGSRLVKRPVRGPFQLVVQDHALDATPLLLELGFDLPHHPEQARVVPDLARLDPAAVLHLAGVVIRIVMAIEQRLARRRDADDVCDSALSQTRHGAFRDQALLLK